MSLTGSTGRRSSSPQQAPRRCYFNHAAQAILSPQVRDVGRSCLHPEIPESAIHDQDEVRRLFAKLVHQDACNIAIMPSTSYCMSWCARNLPKIATSGKILLLRDQFCSVVYPLQELCQRYPDQRFELLIVDYPVTSSRETWTDCVLRAIQNNTGNDIIAAVLPPLHWSDGSLLDLQAIGTMCVQKQIPLIIDGTQAVGILPLGAIPGCIVLACSVHKWLRCPAGVSLVYISPTLHSLWEPLESHAREHSLPSGWEALPHSMNARGYYPEPYWSDARKFDSGGKANPILLPMMHQALQEVVSSVDPFVAQRKLRTLLLPLLDWASARGFEQILSHSQAFHIIGLRHPDLTTAQMLQCVQVLADQGIDITLRCGAYRVSPYIDTTPEDVKCLVGALESFHDKLWRAVDPVK